MIETIPERTVVCVRCGESDIVDTKLRLFGEVSVFDVRPQGVDNGRKYYRDEGADGWLCEHCRRRRTELLNSDPVTVPEPPSEWRFCQSCGVQIDPTRLDGQHCADCLRGTDS